MKSTKKKIPLIILTVLTIVLCVMEGCVLECPLPYAMTDGELRFGRVEGICSVAGVFFRLVNTGKKTISAVEMTCTVYDHSGKSSSFIGNHTCTAGDAVSCRKRKAAMFGTRRLYFQYPTANRELAGGSTIS